MAKFQECKKARSDGTTASITDFSCPAGEFTTTDAQEMTDERLAYTVATNILLNEADKKVKKYLENLYESRDKDAVAWVHEIRTCFKETADSPKDNLNAFYRRVCDPLFIRDLLNTEKEKIIVTQNFYPHNVCHEAVRKKMIAWE